MTLDFSIPKMKLFYVDKEKMSNQERSRLRKLRIKQVNRDIIMHMNRLYRFRKYDHFKGQTDFK